MINSVFEYIDQELQGIEDPEAKKNAFLRIVSECLDKGQIQFKGGENAGYISEMEATEGFELSRLNEIIDNNETVKKWRSQVQEERLQIKNRGGYETLIITIDNATRKIFEGMGYNKRTNVTAISPQRAEDRKRKIVSVLLENKNKLIEVATALDEDDKRTFWGVCTLIKEGVLRVTPIQLYRKTYLDPNAHPTEEQLARQDESIRKMASIYMTLDTREIVRTYPELERVPIGANFVEIKQYYGRTENGTFSDYYEFTGLPILFEYALILDQVKTLPFGTANVFSTNLRKTRENEKIVQIIGDRVLALEGNGDVNKKITYERLLAGVDFSNCKSNQAKRNKLYRKKREIAKHLQFLIDANLIASANETPEGDGIEIEL